MTNKLKTGSLGTFAVMGILAFGATSVSAIESANAQAYGDYQNVNLQTFTLPAGGFHDLNVSGNYIENLTVTAYSTKGGQLEVVVNGKNKGTIYVPAKDPTYTVTIREACNSIRFVHTTGGDVTFSKVTSSELGGGGYQQRQYRQVPSRFLQRESNIVGFVNRHGANYFSNDQLYAYIDLMKFLVDKVTPQEYATYLQPIKIQAAFAVSTVNGRGPISQKSIKNMVELVRSVNAAQPLLERLMQIEDRFDVVVDLLSMVEQLADDLDI
jgi:hypothetical protein